MRLKLLVVFAIIANVFLNYANAQGLIPPAVPPVRPKCPTVNIQKATDTICGNIRGDIYVVQSLTTGSNLRIEWATNGSGAIYQSFYNDPVATYAYTPGEGQGADISFYVTVRDTLSRCAIVKDTLKLRINDAPRLRFLDDHLTACGNSPVYIEPELLGTASTIYWTTPGDGYFSPNPAASTFYYPGKNDRRSGAAFFYAVTNDPEGPCPAVRANTYVEFTDGILDAGPDTIVCANMTGGIFSAAATTYSGNYFPEISWTTNGSGSFTDPTSAYTDYNYTTADAAKGEIELYVTGTDNFSNCGTYTDTLKVRLQQKPGLRFTNEVVRGCGRRPRAAVEVILSGSATGGRWSTSGSGFFENPTALKTVYFASTSDLGRRSLGLKFTTNDPYGPCTSDSGVIKAYFSTYCVGRKSAVDEQLNEEQTIVSVYPNPVKDVLYINGGSAIAKSNIRLTDITGKAVPFKWEGNSSINVASLKPGIYFVHCASNGRRQIFKVIKL